MTNPHVQAQSENCNESAPLTPLPTDNHGLSVLRKTVPKGSNALDQQGDNTSVPESTTKKANMNNNPRSFARITIALKLLTLVLVAFQAGCQVAWKVPTRYTITDIRDDATQTELRSALSRYGYSNEVNSPEFAFTLTKVETVSDLKKVQQTIQEISKRSRVPVQFNRATLDFRSVFGQGTSDIHLKGDATIGARVWLDTGEPEVITAEVNGEGAWSANISRTVKLRDRGGWVYGAFEKDGVKQFMKINVLDTSSSTKIREEDLPSDSVLRKR